MAKLERKDKEDKAGQDERGREGRKEGRTYLIVIPQALLRLEHGLSGCLVIFAFQGLDTTQREGRREGRREGGREGRKGVPTS
jgi:hypothetical protein